MIMSTVLPFVVILAIYSLWEEREPKGRQRELFRGSGGEPRRR